MVGIQLLSWIIIQWACEWLSHNTWGQNSYIILKKYIISIMKNIIWMNSESVEANSCGTYT